MVGCGVGEICYCTFYINFAAMGGDSKPSCLAFWIIVILRGLATSLKLRSHDDDVDSIFGSDIIYLRFEYD